MGFWLIRFAMCALMPKAAGFPGIEETGVDAWLHRYWQEASKVMYLGVFLGAVIFQISPILTLGWPVPAFLLSEKRLEEHAEKIPYASLYLVRQPIFLVKMVAGLCWGADPAVRRQLNLVPYGEDPGTWRAA